MKSEETSKHCSRCGRPFACQGDETCWCQNYSLNSENLTRLNRDYADCLCPDCLKSFAQSQRD